MFNVLGFAADLYGGITSYQSSVEQASLLTEQGVLTRDDYNRQAALTREEGQRLRSKQTMEYISSGVEAVGTPLLVMRETLTKSLAKAQSFEIAGINYERLYRRKAEITKSEGRAELISGIARGASQLI